MAATISINEKDLKRINQKLDSMVSGYKEPLKDSAELLLNEIQNNFTQQGAIYQGDGYIRTKEGKVTTRKPAWKPLAASTRRRRESLGFNGARPILEMTGKLRSSFDVAELSDTETTVASGIDWAIYHQDGGKRLPQRKLAGFSNKGVAAIAQIFTNYIKRIIG